MSSSSIWSRDLLVELGTILRRHHRSRRRVRAWLRRCNPNLAYRAPLEVMACPADWVRWLIANLGVGG